MGLPHVNGNLGSWIRLFTFLGAIAGLLIGLGAWASQRSTSEVQLAGQITALTKSVGELKASVDTLNVVVRYRLASREWIEQLIREAKASHGVIDRRLDVLEGGQ